MSKRSAEDDNGLPAGRRPKFERGGNSSRDDEKSEAVGDPLTSKPIPQKPLHERTRKSAVATLFTKPASATTTKGSEGRLITLTANYFPLKKCETWTLCKHHVDFSPPEERTFMKKILMKAHKGKFKGYLFDGSSLFTIQNACPNGEPLVLKSMRNNGEEVEITIKFVGTCEPRDSQYLQIFNIIMRECLASLKLQLIRRNYFDPGAKIEIPEFKLELWPGYVTSMVQCEEAVLLQTEITYKVLRKDTAYDLIRQIQQQHQQRRGDFRMAILTALTGAIIMTQYNNRTYRVEDVDFKASPAVSTFKVKKKGVEEDITFEQYYLTKYNIRIKDRRQPLLVAKSNTKDRFKGKVEMVLLIPELCVMTGLTDEMRSNFQLMKAVTNHTNIGPAARVERLMNFSARMNGVPEIKTKLEAWGLELDRKLVSIPGRVLPNEAVVYGNRVMKPVGPDSDWTKDLRNVSMALTIEVTRWGILFPDRVRRDVGEFLKTLQRCAGGLGLNLGQPLLRGIPDDRAATYVEMLEQIVNEVNLQLIIIIVPNNNTVRYSAIKRKCIIEKRVSSQVVTCRTLTNRGLMSIATKIAIQINCKLGGIPWGVNIAPKGMLIAGFDVARDPQNKRYKYSATVSTWDATCTRYFSAISHHGDTAADISTSFSSNLMKGIERYRQVNKTLPMFIVIFREGVSDGDLPFVYEHEVQNIKKNLGQMYEKSVLRLAFIVVTKRMNARIIFGTQNPPPGSVVDNVITNPNRYDFYLVSQAARFGTVSPTHYNVLEDTTGAPTDKLQRLAYKLTHLYFNWSGTVRVPAPCQYAHKLAALAAQNLGRTHNNLDNLLYFL